MPSTPPESPSATTVGDPVASLYAALADLGDLVAGMPSPALLYAEVVRILEQHLGAMLVIVGEIDYAAGVLRRRAPEVIPPGQEDLFPDCIPIALARPMFWQGEIEVEPNIAEAPGREAMRPGYARHGIRASAAVPIQCSGKVHAAMILRSRDPLFFSPSLLQLLQRAALSISHALEGDLQRTRLQESRLAAERSQRALRLLSVVLRAASHAQTDSELFADACQAVVVTGDYPVCWAGLLQADSPTTLELHAHAGRGADSYHALRLPLGDPDISGSVTAAVLETRRPVLKLPRLGGDERWASHARTLALGALLGLPLRLHGEITGVIVIGADTEDAFATGEIEIFVELAQELSLGLDRLRTREAQTLAKDELRLNLRRFQAILASRFAGVLVLDMSAHVQFCNAMFCELFDLTETPEQLIGLPSAAIIERVSKAYANPEREVQMIHRLLQRNQPLESEELLMSRGRTFLRSFWPITIDGVPQGRVWHHIDITERKAQAAEVERLAYYDPLTGLPNRRLFMELLERAQAQSRRHQTRLALGVLDLDDFKRINDQLGHVAADDVLQEIAHRLNAVLRDGDVLARLGGDEFAVLLADLESDHERRALSARLLETIRQPIPRAGEIIRLSASIGWADYPQDNVDAETLMGHADFAMYAAKDSGRDCDQLYSPALENIDADQRLMRGKVVSALEHGGLVVLFQPIVALVAPATTGAEPALIRVVGVETLLRLRDGNDELISPARFQQALDDAVLARPIGCHVLDAALATCSHWLEQGLHMPVAVNISTRHLMHAEFLPDLRRALSTHRIVPADMLSVEVTETGPLMDPLRARSVIEACRALGIHVSLDDFGTGTASLSHIQQMEVDTLKIDQSFVRDILVEPRNIAIAAGIITTANLLGITVIAEGVATEAQGKRLLMLGCRHLQGYAIAEPMAAEAVPAWASQWQPPASWT